MIIELKRPQNWIALSFRFSHIPENEEYIEKETEFDKDIEAEPIDAKILTADMLRDYSSDQFFSKKNVRENYKYFPHSISKLPKTKLEPKHEQEASASEQNKPEPEEELHKPVLEKIHSAINEEPAQTAEPIVDKAEDKPTELKPESEQKSESPFPTRELMNIEEGEVPQATQNPTKVDFVNTLISTDSLEQTSQPVNHPNQDPDPNQSTSPAAGLRKKSDNERIEEEKTQEDL